MKRAPPTCQETVAVFSFRSVSASMLYGHMINGGEVSTDTPSNIIIKLVLILI